MSAGRSEEAPIVIRLDKGKFAAYTIGLAAIATLLYFVPYGGKKLSGLEVVVFHGLALALAGLGILGIAATFIRPAEIVLSSEGIACSGWLRTRRFRWADITDVAYKKFWPGYAPSYWIVLSLRPNHSAGKRRFGEGENERVIEGRGWPMSAEELFQIIVAARKRWLQGGS